MSALAYAAQGKAYRFSTKGECTGVQLHPTQEAHRQWHCRVTLYCLGLAYLGLVQVDSDHSMSVGNGLNRENNNNNIAHGAMIPGRAGQRLDPCGRRTTLDPLIERYSAFHH